MTTVKEAQEALEKTLKENEEKIPGLKEKVEKKREDKKENKEINKEVKKAAFKIN